MNEEELINNENEPDGKEELQKKEEELAAREAELAKREADAASIAQTIKQEFEARLEAQKQEFENRLRQRDDVIRQLANGNSPHEEECSAIANLNKKRRLQKAA